MTQMLHAVGMDAGNSAAKVVIQLGGLGGTDNKPVRLLVPNCYALAEDLPIPPQADDKYERLHVEIENPIKEFEGSWFVGALAANQFTSNVEQDRRRNKEDSANINLVTPAVLAGLCQNGDQVTLGIGLPISDFTDERVRKVVERLKRKFRITFGKYSTRPGETVEFEVVHVECFPQTAAGFFAQMAGKMGDERPEWEDSTVTVIDLGLGQTGVAHMSRMEPKKEGCYSIDNPAFLHVAQGVQQYLNSKYGRDLTVPEVLEAIEAGKYQMGKEPVDLSSVIELECIQLAKGTRRRNEAQTPVSLRDSSTALLLIGGGALAPGIADVFANEFNVPAYVGDDPRYANAAGLCRRAELKYQKIQKIRMGVDVNAAR